MNGKASVISYFFCELAFSRIHSFQLWHGHVVHDIERLDTGGNRDLTPTSFSVYNCFNIILQIVNKQSVNGKARSMLVVVKAGDELPRVRSPLPPAALPAEVRQPTSPVTSPVTKVHR